MIFLSNTCWFSLLTPLFKTTVSWFWILFLSVGLANVSFLEGLFLVEALVLAQGRGRSISSAVCYNRSVHCMRVIDRSVTKNPSHIHRLNYQLCCSLIPGCPWPNIALVQNRDLKYHSFIPRSNLINPETCRNLVQVFSIYSL